VIEEEELELHFGWACFGLLLLFRAWIVCRTRVQKGLEGMVRVCKGWKSRVFFFHLAVIKRVNIKTSKKMFFRLNKENTCKKFFLKNSKKESEGLQYRQ
jgi:hypothetical protein